MPQPIYLDHNSTTPSLAEVVEAMRACWAEPILNPASQHSFGRRARVMLEDARDRIAEILGATTAGSARDRVIFTSGGTEANNLALRGLLPLPPGEGRGEGAPPHIVVSAIEHSSISALADHLETIGHAVDRLGVDANGVIRVDDLPRLLRPETLFVAAMLANNETGVVQPIAELAAICAERSVPLHTDAAQAAGKLPLSFRELGVATMSIAAHKFGGPLGIGALIVRHDIDLAPQLLGGFQQSGIRAGTESVALTVGMLTALERWESNRHDWATRLKTLRDAFESQLLQIELPPPTSISSHSEPPGSSRRTTTHPVVFGHTAPRLPNTSGMAFVGLDRQQLFLALDQAGVACSAGSACASGSSEPSPVLTAMGCDPAVISSALRFSLGISTTEAEVEEAARRIIQTCNDLGRAKRF